MRQFFLCFLCFISPPICALYSQVNRSASAPYISGDGFRLHCNFSFDELSPFFSPSSVKNGDTIFVKTDYLDRFFSTVHPFISSRYILVSHNSDASPGKFISYLDDNKIIAWFAQNANITHPKLHPIPIGIANRCWSHGNVDVIREEQNTAAQTDKDIFLYLNFAPSSYPKEREVVLDLLEDKPYITVSKNKKHNLYLQDLARSIFVLSPRGNGLDTHRTWESLLMGAIPIVLSSHMDSVYENLPVLILEDWRDLTLGFLEQKYNEISAQSHQVEKIYLNYWLDLIDSYKCK